MTNYMGKRRMLKILLQMLSDRPELQELIKKEHDFLKYTTFRGSEWLKFWLGDCRYEVSATGEPCKVVSFKEYRVNEFSDVMSLYNQNLTKYTENFEPLPLATWLSGGCELRKRGYYPFQPEREDPAYNFDEASGLKPDSFVCYNIAKQSKLNKER